MWLCFRSEKRSEEMLRVFVVLAALLLAGCHGACTNPKVSSSVYSTSNALFSHETVFIVEAELQCDGNETPSLHALVGDQLIPVAKALGVGKYQVSWAHPHNEAHSGTVSVSFYDDDGTAAIRKAMRYNEDLSAKPVFSVDLDHKVVTSSGWMAPPFIALVGGMLVWWLAYMTKGKLQE